jgi:tetratricopeptide (TPR) repeat protein
MMRETFPGGTVLHLLIILVLGLLAYANTFQVPFQWDGLTFLKENPLIKDIGHFSDLKGAEGLPYYGAVRKRYLGYLSFALNYRVHGFGVGGYHAVNVTVHLLGAMLVYALALVTLRSPFLKRSALRRQEGGIALLASLMFALHPVQTEAVTYIFQRFVLLGAFLSLLCLVCYALFRLSVRRGWKVVWYGVSLVSAPAAMLMKESAFILPFLLILFEVSFLSGHRRGRILAMLPFLATLAVIPAIYAGGQAVDERLVRDGSRGFLGYSRPDYLLTQSQVVMTYVRLLFLPVNQNLAYDQRALTSVFDAAFLLPLLGHLVLLGCAVFLFIRSRRGEGGLRIVGFGIVWFYAALFVESGLIPLPRLSAEYRVYLPSAGVFLAVASGLFLLREKLRGRAAGRAPGALIMVLPLLLAAFTVHRNTLWLTETGLWKDVVRKAPGSVEGHTNLGRAYFVAGETEKALEEFRTALALYPYSLEAHNNIALAYEELGQPERAMEHYRKVLEVSPEYVATLNNAGISYAARGRPEKAMEYYRRALKLRPDHAGTYNNLALAHAAKGEFEAAIIHFTRALELEPESGKAHGNLGLVYALRGEHARALEHLNASLGLEPDYPDARLGLAIVYYSRGEVERAKQELALALRSRPGFPEAMKLMEAIRKKGDPG